MFPLKIILINILLATILSQTCFVSNCQYCYRTNSLRCASCNSGYQFGTDDYGSTDYSTCVTQSKNSLAAISIVGLVFGNLCWVCCVGACVFYCIRRCRINAQQYHIGNLQPNRDYNRNHIQNLPAPNYGIQSNIQMIDYKCDIHQQGFIYDDFKDNCAVCLRNECNVVTACKHYFHLQCLKQWIGRRLSCPVCNNIAVMNVLLVVCMKCKNKTQIICLRNPIVRENCRQCHPNDK